MTGTLAPSSPQSKESGFRSYPTEAFSFHFAANNVQSPRTGLVDAEIGVYTRDMDSPCYCDLLRTAARKTTAIYDRHLAEVGLTLAQYKLLKKIARAGELSISELAALCDLDRSTIGRNVQVLEKHDLVEETSCGDGRRCMLKLTETGRQRFAAAVPLWQAAQTEIEATLNPDQITALTALSEAL